VASSKSPFSRFLSGEAKAPLEVLSTVDDFWFQSLKPWIDQNWWPGVMELVWGEAGAVRRYLQAANDHPCEGFLKVH
jgi:hypothetical protein